MRKSVLSIITAIFLALSVTGCSQAKVKQEIENSSGSYNEESRTETWREAYINFLKDTDKENTRFSLRDLDDNGTPELIIVKTDGKVSESILTAYSYNNSVYKIGEYSDPKIGVAGLHITNNPKFTGLRCLNLKIINLF